MLDGAHGAQHGVELQVFRHLAPLSHTRRIHNHKLVAEFVVVGGDGIPGGAGNGGYDVAFLSQQGVGEGALAHVGAAHDGNVREVCVVLIGPVILRKYLEHLVQEVSRTGTVGGRYGPHFSEAQGVEIVRIVHLLPGIHLVHAEDDRLFGAPEKIRYLGIVVRDARGGFAHEEDHIGLLDGDGHLAADGVFKDVVRVGGVAARVHHGEFPAAPLAFAVMTVPGYTRRLIHNGLAHSHQAVEKGRLSHVRSPDYRNQSHNSMFFRFVQGA